ncbi:hypothetical protein QBC32DRAFT_89021 [Pseudoneurospora amorphoporcata]|uniref:Uncharacterized protein n=1 Tax=Pseudoneurospora amorphoporcata TaxID=241081 RepID=A0AAN6SIP9_9PEZI|nr:hypothetical protein QBC32DRAFT_89021 [Pseudoneurospora amorphoporcata]
MADWNRGSMVDIYTIQSQSGPGKHFGILSLIVTTSTNLACSQFLFSSLLTYLIARASFVLLYIIIRDLGTTTTFFDGRIFTVRQLVFFFLCVKTFYYLSHAYTIFLYFFRKMPTKRSLGRYHHPGRLETDRIGDQIRSNLFLGRAVCKCKMQMGLLCSNVFFCSRVRCLAGWLASFLCMLSSWFGRALL